MDLNLRTGNANKYRSIKLMPRGSEVKHLETTNNGWFKISYNGIQGYVPRGDVTSRSNYDSGDTTIHNIPVTVISRKIYKTIIGQNLRTGNTNQYRAIAFIPRGKEVEYLGTTNNDWFKVRTENGIKGYIYRGDVTSTGELQSIEIETRGLVFDIGKSSDQIKLLKDFFRARKATNVTGGYNYDSRTKQLVKDYQKLKGLQVDGFAGKLTLAEMNKEIRNKNYKIGLYIPYTNIKGDMIIINKSSNTLYLMKNGIIQNSYPVATGKTESLTPNGKFKLVVKFKNPSWGGAGISPPIAGGAPNNPLGTRWLGISYGGGGKYGVHGNAAPKFIGTYASLGCVRMFNQDVEKLYEKVKIGTPIWLGSEKQLKSYGVNFKYSYGVENAQAKINITSEEKDLNVRRFLISEDDMKYDSFDEIYKLINGNTISDEEIKNNLEVLGGHDVEFLPNDN